jgi:alpha-ketoglutarate-dependent 2,4-dichlorophenoxyacetate dioxygenase
MHSRVKAAPKDSPWLKDVDPNDYPFGRHTVVQTHASGRQNLYIANHMHHLEYKTPRSKDFVPTKEQPFERVPEPEGTALIEKLLAHATQEKYLYSVEWENDGDLVLWDNTCVMHKAGKGTFMEKYARDMRRYVEESPPVVIVDSAHSSTDVLYTTLVRMLGVSMRRQP